MTGSDDPSIRSTNELVERIRALKSPIEALAAPYRAAIAEFAGRSSPDYWVLVAHSDALIRCRLFVEQNFLYIEPVGMLGVTRYLFELLVWLRLMGRDLRYGLVYYHELMDTQRRFYSDLKSHLLREVVLLRQFASEQDRLTEQRLAEVLAISDSVAQVRAARDMAHDVFAEVDTRMARGFSLYGEQAKHSGYGFQAHLVETKAVADAAERESSLMRELSGFVATLTPDVRALIPKRWNWRDQAKLAGMAEEYDFVYTYTSKLMHATPASLTTNQKNLEYDEIRMFLRYCHVRLLDVIELAQTVVSRHTHGSVH